MLQVTGAEIPTDIILYFLNIIYVGLASALPKSVLKNKLFLKCAQKTPTADSLKKMGLGIVSSL